MERKKFPVVNIGTASILVIFVILCLVTFAMLSLVSANVDYQFSKKIADRTKEYYTASNEAEKQLAQIDDQLANALTSSPNAFYKDATDLLTAIDGIDVVSQSPEEPLTVSFQVPMNENTQLEIVLEIVYPAQTGQGYYQIAAWKETSTKEWKAENNRNLLQSNESQRN